MGSYPVDMAQWPDLHALELLVAVADHGSLTAAAREVRMAQPNASRTMSRLERHLRVPLVVRSTRGSRLTPAGLVVVDWARDVLASARVLTDGAASLDPSHTASLRVAASQTIAEHLLPVWLATWRVREDPAPVTVAVRNSAEVIHAVLEGDAGLGFIEDPQRPRGVQSEVIGADELILVVAPAHPWARRRLPVGPDELAGEPLVTREPGSGTRVALTRALRDRVQTPPAMELPSNAAVRVSVLSGVAPAVLSRLAVADALAARTLVAVPTRDLDLRRPLRAVWSGPRRLQGAARDFVGVARTLSTGGSS